MKKWIAIIALLLIAVVLVIRAQFFVPRDGAGVVNTQWKTYVDPKSGFQFEYPASATVNYGQGLQVSSPHGSYYFRVSTTTADRYVTSPTLHTQYRYTYDPKSNTFTAEDGFSNSRNMIGGACPPVQRFSGSQSGAVDYYVSHLSGKENGGGNEDYDYFVITNKGFVIEIKFDERSRRSIESFRFIGDTAQIKALCPRETYDSSGWKQYDIKDTHYMIFYPPTYFIVKEGSKNVLFSDKSGSIKMSVSDTKGSFDGWKECSREDSVTVLDSRQTIKYLCDATQFKFFSDIGGLFISADLSGTDFYDPKIRLTFGGLVRSFDVQ